MVYYKVSVWLVEDHSSLTNTNSPNRRQILTLSEIDFPTYTTTPENFIFHPQLVHRYQVQIQFLTNINKEFHNKVQKIYIALFSLCNQTTKVNVKTYQSILPGLMQFDLNIVQKGKTAENKKKFSPDFSSPFS